jgi:hypothetical protein
MAIFMAGLLPTETVVAMPLLRNKSPYGAEAGRKISEKIFWRPKPK